MEFSPNFTSIQIKYSDTSFTRNLCFYSVLVDPRTQNPNHVQQCYHNIQQGDKIQNVTHKWETIVGRVIYPRK
jgi:hypothetical protein